MPQQPLIQVGDTAQVKTTVSTMTHLTGRTTQHGRAIMMPAQTHQLPLQST